MLFWKLVVVSFRSQLQYPASFLMLALAHFISTFVDVIGIWILFDRFNFIQGWTLFEIGLSYGAIQMGFALAESFARGFDTFSQMVKQGDFDRVLLRPINPFLQMASREVQLLRVGRFLQGLTILIISASELSLPLFSSHFLVIILSILGTACLFYGLFVIQATISFWTIETLELMNITTYGGLQLGQYPMSIYKKPIRLIFTLVIPLACTAYYPIATLLRKEPLPLSLGLIAPLAGALFLYLAYLLWRLGVRHYSSTGS